MSRWRNPLWIPYLGVVAYFGYRAALSPTSSEQAAWLQVLIAALAIPALFYELYRIRRSFTEKPNITIGVASVRDLPLSRLRNLPALSPVTSIDYGYSVFWLVIRNSGQVAATHMKLHLEYLTPQEQQTFLFSPVIEVDDWLGDKRFTFKKVNNADFVFIGGQDWVLHANDTEMFYFSMTTATGKASGSTGEMERPSPGTYILHCTAWADGLDKAVSQDLTIHIVRGLEQREEQVRPDLSNLA